MKKLLIVAALCAALFTTKSFGASTTVATLASTTNSLISTNSLLVTSIVFANGAATNVIVGLFDGPLASIYWTNAAFSNQFNFMSNLVTAFTNFSGVIQTNTNTVLATAWQTTAQATNTRQRLGLFVISSNNTYTYTPPTPLAVSFGLLSTNYGPCTITVNYSTLIP